jgi:hypothetical protein
MRIVGVPSSRSEGRWHVVLTEMRAHTLPPYMLLFLVGYPRQTLIYGIRLGFLIVAALYSHEQMLAWSLGG